MNQKELLAGALEALTQKATYAPDVAYAIRCIKDVINGQEADSLEEAYKKILTELHELKESSVPLELLATISDTTLIIHGDIVVGTLSGFDFPEPVAEELSQEGKALVTVIFSLEK